ncbi:diiron oxygenase [Streptomyces glaucus]|uniref:p-aminobenzoate N-oxygenase AurF n=1 Tax=Streptomyces glaucus TaxID=284029 RepID=A0ABP5W8J5_9ACTN
MCGTVGMFVGCSALSYCPRRLLAGPAADSEREAGEDAAEDAGRDAARTPGRRPVPEPGEYRSPFQSWYERSSVRSAPRRTVGDGDGAAGTPADGPEDTGGAPRGARAGRADATGPVGGAGQADAGAEAEDGTGPGGARRFFPPELVPVTRHPLIRALPATVFDEVLVQHLYRYLDFTIKLEHLVVNRTVLGIAHGSVGVAVPEEMRLDAYKMYCDEAYHALFSADLAAQVRQATGIVPRLPGEPFFLRRLREISAGLPASRRPLAELLFVIVSETLISASLADVPGHEGVVPAVTGTIRDHALDEGRHHAYFAHFLQRLWAQLEPGERRAAARLVPRLMDAFLRPDTEALRAELTGYGLTRDSAEQVAAEVYTPEVLSSHALATSRQARRYFRELGAFDDAQVRDELAAYGLLE